MAAGAGRRGNPGGVPAFRPYSVTMDDASMVGLMGRVTGTIGVEAAVLCTAEHERLTPRQARIRPGASARQAHADG